MEFWGVEVQSGKPLKVTPEEDCVVHISQASLGNCKGKKGETVPLYVKVGDKKFVLATLSPEGIPQTNFDLLFDKEFELSHNWGKGSVHFVGFKSPNMENDEGEYFSDSEEEEEEEMEAPAAITANGNAAKAVAKPKAKPAEVKKNAKPVSVDDDEEDDSDSEGMDVDEDDSDDEDDSEEEEETPKKPESNKKRANEAAPKTPVSAKKAKAAEVTPKKTEEKKKGGHTATPHPAKKGGKTPTTATQSPKSASQVSCGSCKKTFNSGNALESHNKAKHSAAK